MELTKEKAIELHRELWNYIADESERQGVIISKIEAFEHFDWPYNICADCWCCEYDSKFNDDCTRCPIKWPEGRCASKKSSPYYTWDICRGRFLDGYDRSKENVVKAAKAAREIANLPENPDA